MDDYILFKLCTRQGYNGDTKAIRIKNGIPQAPEDIPPCGVTPLEIKVGKVNNDTITMNIHEETTDSNAKTIWDFEYERGTAPQDVTITIGGA